MLSRVRIAVEWLPQVTCTNDVEEPTETKVSMLLAVGALLDKGDIPVFALLFECNVRGSGMCSCGDNWLAGSAQQCGSSSKWKVHEETQANQDGDSNRK